MPETTPKRIQRKRTRGWKAPEGAVNVTRPGKWGNPFTVKGALESGYAKTEDEAQKLVVECFREWIRGGQQWWQGGESMERRYYMTTNMADLRGKDLMCWCPLDQPCHADVLLEIANA